MRIKFTGAFKELDEFIARVERTPRALQVVSVNLAEETIELIREGFDNHRDPYGKKWKDHAQLTKLVRPGGQILEDSGGLKASWHRRWANETGLQVASGKSYAIYAQKGTGIYGPRKTRIVPIRAKRLRIPLRAGGAVFRRSVAGAPKRRMVPENNRLPASWRRRYVETARDVLTEFFR